MAEVVEDTGLVTLQGALEQFRADLAENLGREPVCVELGSGMNPEPGFISVDLDAHAERQADLFEFPWPFESDSVDFFYSSHFIEHVPDWGGFWQELYRVIAPGGIVVAMTPYWSSVRAWQDPTHKQAISPERYVYLSRKARQRMGVDHYSADVDFEMFHEPWFAWNKDFADKSEAAKRYAREHYLNAVDDMVVFLRAVKERSE